MTITTQILRNDYTANGVNTSFSFTFPIFYESNATPKFSLEVITTDASGVETIKTETTDYTITYTTIKNGVISQGNVVFNTAPTNGHKITLLRKVNLTQNGDFTNKGTDDFNGATLESALDKLTLLSLQQQENLNRVVRLPKSSPLSNIEFPIDATRANQVVVINNAGDNLSTKELANIGLAPVSPYIATLLDDTTASQARTTLDAQQLNANLSALAGLTGASNKIPYFTGAGAMALTDVINPATTTTRGITFLNDPITIAFNGTTAMDISAGVVQYDNGSGRLRCSAITSKTLQASGSWTAGSSANGLDTGARANSTWYNIFEIVNNSTGANDILYSTSRTSPSVPSGYTLVAWIGKIRTDGSGNIDQSYLAKRTNYGQIVNFMTGSVATTTTLIPRDDTIPQNTEGAEFMQLAIEPISSSSILEIDCGAFLSNSGTSITNIGALFKDSVANALVAGELFPYSSQAAGILRLNYRVISGTTSTATFKFRAGPESASTITFNGYASARKYGGVANSFLTVKEYL